MEKALGYNDIIKAVKDFAQLVGVEPTALQVISKGSMVLHGICETTRDIDLQVMPSAVSQARKFIKKNNLTSKGYLSCNVVRDVYKYEDIEFCLDWDDVFYYPVYFDGVGCQKLENLRAFKLRLSRLKDYADIALIDQKLSEIQYPEYRRFIEVWGECFDFTDAERIRLMQLRYLEKPNSDLGEWVLTEPLAGPIARVALEKILFDKNPVVSDINTANFLIPVQALSKAVERVVFNNDESKGFYDLGFDTIKEIVVDDSYGRVTNTAKEVLIESRIYLEPLFKNAIERYRARMA